MTDNSLHRRRLIKGKTILQRACPRRERRKTIDPGGRFEPRTNLLCNRTRELRFERERGNMPRVFYNPVDIDPVLIDALDFQVALARLKTDLEDYEANFGKKNHTQALLNLINKISLVISNTKEALREC